MSQNNKSAKNPRPKPKTIVLEKFPAMHSAVYRTKKGTLYLKKPGVVLLSAPAVNIEGMRDFLKGFSKNLQFEKYLNDPDPLPPAEQLCKTAGQLCYVSFGPKRTWNKDADKYFERLISSGHGSVLEHANFTMLFYGVSRSLTHELVRHRAGMGYSQVSQRYVSGSVLRFVERPEYQNNKFLHKQFLKRIDRAKKEYEELAERLLAMQKKGYKSLTASQTTDLRKKVQQTARSLLPNETEAPIVVTGNVRAWRHIIYMRASQHAETEIRQALFNAFLILREIAPILFRDFEIIDLPDGTRCVSTPYPKV